MVFKKVLITGVHGLVGGAIFRRLSRDPARFEVYGLDRSDRSSDRVGEDEVVALPEGRFFRNDLSDLSELERAYQGMDTIVHMAADPCGESGWECLQQSNIQGAYFVFEAAKRAGVKRIVYASSIQVNNGNFQCDESIAAVSRGEWKEGARPALVSPADPAWPTNLYGASKLFNEALGRVYSTGDDGMSCIGLRLGWVITGDSIIKADASHVSCTQNDAARLVECCVTAPDSVRHEIFFGLSRNRNRWADMERAKSIVGFEPEDDDSQYFR